MLESISRNFCKRVGMKQYCLAGILGALILVIGGCQSQQQQSGAEERSPYLIKTPSSLAVPPTKSGDSRIDPALKLRRMEMSHQERLAELEAKKAETLRRLELEKARSVEELRKQSKEIEAQKALELEREKRRTAVLLAQKDRDLKALEARRAREHDQARIAVETVKGEYGERIKNLDSRLKERTLRYALAALTLILLFWFLLTRYRKSQEAKEREEQRRHEAWILQQKQEQERIETILRIIASSETDKELKLELTRLLQQGIDPEAPKLIEHKTKE